MKTGALVCLILFVLGALLGLVQLWFAPLPANLFFKAMASLAILFVVVLAVTLVKNEYLSEKKMRDGGFLD